MSNKIDESEKGASLMLGGDTKDYKDLMISLVKPFYNRTDINEILMEMYEKGASDIHIQSDDYIKIKYQRDLVPVTQRPITDSEVKSFIKEIYGENATSQMNSREDINTSHAINTRDGKQIRFRVNAIAVYTDSGDGVQITIRTIQSTPIPLKVLKLEKEIWDNFVPEQGLIIVTGPTGSGKTTLMSSCIREILETPNSSKKIVTYEQPIEYVYDSIDIGNNIITQTEVPRHIASFGLGLESSMRRAPNIILIGEARDKETIMNSILASQTGHLVYATAHTNSVAETVSRLINVFSPEERTALQFDLIESLKMIVAQRLIRGVNGKNVAIKEYLIFDREVKRRLRDTDPNLISSELDKIVNEKKLSLYQDALRKFESNIISEEELEKLKLSYG